MLSSIPFCFAFCFYILWFMQRCFDTQTVELMLIYTNQTLFNINYLTGLSVHSKANETRKFSYSLDDTCVENETMMEQYKF